MISMNTQTYERHATDQCTSTIVSKKRNPFRNPSARSRSTSNFRNNSKGDSKSKILNTTTTVNDKVQEKENISSTKLTLAKVKVKAVTTHVDQTSGPTAPTDAQLGNKKNSSLTIRIKIRNKQIYQERLKLKEISFEKAMQAEKEKKEKTKQSKLHRMMQSIRIDKKIKAAKVVELELRRTENALKKERQREILEAAAAKKARFIEKDRVNLENVKLDKTASRFEFFLACYGLKQHDTKSMDSKIALIGGAMCQLGSVKAAINALAKVEHARAMPSVIVNLTETASCMYCRLVKSKKEFSKSQWNKFCGKKGKRTKKSKCRMCLEQRNAKQRSKVLVCSSI